MSGNFYVEEYMFEGVRFVRRNGSVNVFIISERFECFSSVRVMM